ncbi:NADPH:quinone oxidoreductase family protein [Sandaracinus amylolyticus]|uniref:Quinone oxidoreductase n=1 Tax=Sandaracinus amylolyticus TaxID=927083 RepID=A0A0F6SGS9_9BACT|nr:NADPH:quinone oxidoreductase family protein [Sandaracinus amylolyticus]AKF09224.1 Quinone oxidoreductase [Sandaracinus amylolyticus]
MRAVLCESLGPVSSSLAVREIDAPRASGGQLVIDVKAAPVNFPDLLMVQGLYQMRPPLPFSPGGEIAGVVREVGPGVLGFAPGQRVMAFCGFGGFAERIVLAPAQCFAMPDEMPFEVGASLFLTYCTAHHALVDRGRVTRGETVLVLGAAGGVGVAAIQIAKALGARVIATASSEEKRQFCLSLGADQAIDPAADLKGTLKSLGGVDVVFDPVGGDLSEPALRALRPRGRFLVIGFASGTIPKLPLNLALLKECDVVGVQWGAFALREPDKQRAIVEDLIRMWRAGAVKPPIHRTYSLDETAQALDDLAQRRVMGKVVVTP